MFNLKEKLNILIAMPKTIYFNFKVLPLKYAIKFPFIVYNNVKLGELHKVFTINAPLKTFMISLGKHSYDGTPEMTKGFFSASAESHIIFNGIAELSYGVSFRAIGKSIIEIGDNFYCNKNCSFIARKHIKIGDDALLGWNVNIMDNDGGNHKIIEKQIAKTNKEKVIIGNHVWICAFSDILKGSIINDNCVVAYKSCVIGEFSGENCIIAGHPARVIKQNIEWIR